MNPPKLTETVLTDKRTGDTLFRARGDWTRAELWAEYQTVAANPYAVRESVGFWLVLAPDGRTMAQCPGEDTAKKIAAALWESAKRRQG